MGGRPAPFDLVGRPVGNWFLRLTASLGPSVVACRAVTTQEEQVSFVVNVTHLTENLKQGSKVKFCDLKISTE